MLHYCLLCLLSHRYRDLRNYIKECFCCSDMQRWEAAQGPSNPNTFLMQELRDAEDAAQRSEQQAADARSKLQRKSEELHDCKSQLSAVQIDLRVRSPEPTCENMFSRFESTCRSLGSWYRSAMLQSFRREPCIQAVLQQRRLLETLKMSCLDQDKTGRLQPDVQASL